jgi:hypothetical protein
VALAGPLAGGHHPAGAAVDYAALPPGGVLDWPPGEAEARDYLLWQTAHGRPIAYGPGLFLPQTLAEDPLVHKLLRGLEDLEARGGAAPEEAGGPSLAGSGLALVVVHKERLSRLERRRAQILLEQALGPPLIDGEIAAWAVR